MKKIGQAERVLKIMKMLCKDEEVYIFQLMEKFNVSSRSIESDIKLLKSFFKQNLGKDRIRGYYLKEGTKSYQDIVSDEAIEEKPLLK